MVLSNHKVSTQSFVAVNSNYWDIGDPECVCEFCGAFLWYEEKIQKGFNARFPKFSLCCRQGRIVLPPSPCPPQILHDLFHKNDRRCKFFLSNIRSFNNMFAFTSMGGKTHTSINNGHAPPVFVLNGENYHQIGSLLPLPNDGPKFAQLYIYDTDNEVSNRMAVVGYVLKFPI